MSSFEYPSSLPPPSPALVLFNQLMQGCDGYSRDFFMGFISLDQLLQILTQNNCKDIVSAAKHGDDICQAFVDAGHRSHLILLQTFVQNGFDVNLRNWKNVSGLMSASEHGRLECVRWLLDHNAIPDLQNDDGWTALMFASNVGFVEIVKALLDHNADVELKNKEGKSALDLAKTEGIKNMLADHVINAHSYVLK